MQTRNPFLNEIARMAGGASSTVSALKEEVEMRVRERVERLLNEMDLVTREDFDAMAELASNARQQSEDLAEKLENVEKRLSALEARNAAEASGNAD